MNEDSEGYNDYSNTDYSGEYETEDECTDEDESYTDTEGSGEYDLTHRTTSQSRRLLDADSDEDSFVSGADSESESESDDGLQSGERKNHRGYSKGDVTVDSQPDTAMSCEESSSDNSNSIPSEAVPAGLVSSNSGDVQYVSRCFSV